jgi:AAA15 family ATPase/GTPase
MYVSKLQLINFKRFSNLTIDLSGFEVPPRLVLLIGANGSGKSSVFDAFGFVERATSLPYSYYLKGYETFFQIRIFGSVSQEFTYDKKEGGAGTFFQKPVDGTSLYGRSALRQVPILKRSESTDVVAAVKENADRPPAYNGIDFRFLNDVEYLLVRLVEGIFEVEKTSQIISKYVEPINLAFQNIFGYSQPSSLRLTKLLPPRENQPALIQFEKGTSKNIHYNALSNGEKEVFNILLNLLTRKEFYTDTVYFIDELDLHLNTFLQKNLIKEIVENWLPENCQLWTASHSLGFIEYANESDSAAIIDLDNLDFDAPQYLYPVSKSSMEIFEIAIPKDSSSLKLLFSGNRLFFAENQDTKYYNILKIPKLIFLPADNKQAVFFRVETGEFEGLIDRDFITESEMELLTSTYKNLFFLQFYCVENYLYHPDNLEEYYQSLSKNFDKSFYIEGITREKENVFSKLAINLKSNRQSYPFFKSEKISQSKEKFQLNTEAILDALRSSNFETYYPYLSMKVYAANLQERSNINPERLASTTWFKTQIQNILERK